LAKLKKNGYSSCYFQSIPKIVLHVQGQLALDLVAQANLINLSNLAILVIECEEVISIPLFEALEKE
jgi:hypothetical protein